MEPRREPDKFMTEFRVTKFTFSVVSVLDDVHLLAPQPRMPEAEIACGLEFRALMNDVDGPKALAALTGALERGERIWLRIENNSLVIDHGKRKPE